MDQEESITIKHEIKYCWYCYNTIRLCNVCEKTTCIYHSKPISVNKGDFILDTIICNDCIEKTKIKLF